jgi:plastocyanin
MVVAMMRDRMRPSLFVVAAWAALAGSAHAASAAVSIKDASFQPPSVTIDVGDSVTWTNVDGFGHTATADDRSWDTGVFATGSRTIVFARAGTFAYHCDVHPVMRGTVNVVAQATPAPKPTPAPTAPPPTPAPTAAPTAPPIAPPTSAPPSATPAPTASPTASPSPTASATATTVVAAQATASPTPTAKAEATAASRSDGGPPPLLVGAAVLAVGALAGLALYRNRRP